MILYVNGDSHAAAAEAVTPYAWACDDGELWVKGTAPHPDNELVSFGAILANNLSCNRINQSQAGGSNARIMRVTRKWIKENTDKLSNTFMLIQWSTWEREEWFHNGKWWQVNSSGIDTVPDDLVDRYKQFVINVDWPTITKKAHQDIWNFHLELKDQHIRHLFFNGNSHFNGTCLENNLQAPIIKEKYDWGANYIYPYSAEMTYNSLLKNNGFNTVNPDSWHFGPDAHCFWGKYLLQYIKDNNLLNPNEIPTD